MKYAIVDIDYSDETYNVAIATDPAMYANLSGQHMGGNLLVWDETGDEYLIVSTKDNEEKRYGLIKIADDTLVDLRTLLIHYLVSMNSRGYGPDTGRELNLSLYEGTPLHELVSEVEALRWPTIEHDSKVPLPEGYTPPLHEEDEKPNGLELGIYVLESSSLNREQFSDYLLKQPYFFDDSEDGLYYCNEDTNVLFAVNDAPIKNQAEGYRPLDLAFFVRYGHPEYFGLEVFPVIERLCQRFDLLLAEDKSKNPRSYTAAQLHAKWLKRNDEEQLAQWHEDIGRCLGYMPREKSNQLWHYLYGSSALQARIQHAHSKMVVGKPLCYRDETNGEVVMVVPWIDIVPLVIPPHTDYLFRVRITKKLGLVPYPKPIGYYDIHTYITQRLRE